MKATVSILCALISAFVLLIPLSACGPGNISDNPLGDLEEMQKEVPFTIILPTYLPDDIGPYPYMVQGPFKREEETLLIKIEYQKQGGDSGYIYIEEQNSSFYVNTDWASHPDRTYFDIMGVKVYEETTESVPYPPNEPIDYGFGYLWNKSGTDFLVDIFGYGQDECRKIVESMIQPIE